MLQAKSFLALEFQSASGSHLQMNRPQLRPAATSPAGRAGAAHAAPAAWGAAAWGTGADSVCQRSCAAALGGAARPPAAQSGAPCAGGLLPLRAPAPHWLWLSQAAAAGGGWLPAAPAPAHLRRDAPGPPHLRRQYGLHHAHYWCRYCTLEAQPRDSPGWPLQAALQGDLQAGAVKVGCLTVLPGLKVLYSVLALPVRLTDALCFTGASQSWSCMP